MSTLRRGQEPPTNTEKLMRRRVSIDPPSSPEIQLTQRQLELQRRRVLQLQAISAPPPPPPLPPPQVDHDENQNPVKRTTTLNPPSSQHRKTLSESYVPNPFSSRPTEDTNNKHSLHTSRSSMSVNIGRKGELPSNAPPPPTTRDQQQPFSTRSNKEPVNITKTSALAEKALRKDNGSAARSALQMKLLNSSGSLLGSRNSKAKPSASLQPKTVKLPHDNNNNTKITNKTEHIPSTAPSMTTTFVPASSASAPTSADDQREFLRNLLASKAKPTLSTAGKSTASFNANSTSAKDSKMPPVTDDNNRPSRLSVQAMHDGALSNLTSSSSSSAEGKAIIRKVLQKTMSSMKGSSKSKSKLGESPRDKVVRAFSRSPRLTTKRSYDSQSVVSSTTSGADHLSKASTSTTVQTQNESSDVSLSRQSLAEHSSKSSHAADLSPKSSSSSGLSLKRLIRIKKGSRLKKAESYLFQSRDPPENKEQDDKQQSLDPPENEEKDDGRVESLPEEGTKNEEPVLSNAKPVAALKAGPSGLKDVLVPKASSVYPKLPLGVSEECSETTGTEDSSTIMGALHAASGGDSLQYSNEDADGIMVYTAQSYDTITSGTSSAVQSLASEAKFLGSSAFQPSVTPKTHQLPKQSDSGHEEQEDYTEFLEALDLNTSYTHSHLWSSFHTVMTGTKRRFTPKPHEHFDSRTEKIITTMNVHLRRTSIVECVKDAQVVNDSKFAKEVEGRISMGSASKSLPSRAPSVTSSNASADKEKLDLIIDSQAKKVCEDRSNSDRKMLSSSQTLNKSGSMDVSTGSMNTPMDTNVVPPTTNVTKKPVVTGMVLTATDANRVDLHEPDDKSDVVPKVEDEKRSVDEVVPIRIDDSCDTAVSIQVVTETTKEKPKSTNVHSFVPMSSTAKRTSSQFQQPKSNDSELPWAGVKLRSVPASSDGIDVSAEKNTDQPPGSSVPSPWAKVKLRPVPLENLDQQQPEKAPDSIVEQEYTGPADSDQNVVDQKRDTSGEPGVKNDATDFKPEVSSSASDTMTNVEDADDDESTVVFSLRGVPGAMDGANASTQVSLRKKCVMMLSLDGKTSKPSVTWSLPRDSIKSMKLDLDSQRVNLLLAAGASKVLAFQDSVDCLNFASAFYDVIKPNQLSDTSETSVCSDITRDTEGRLEHLNDEEQKVLETYRQARRTNPLEAAIQVSIYNGEHVQLAQTNAKTGAGHFNSNVASSDNSSSDTQPQSNTLPLDSTEIEVGEMYKKMLRLKIAPDAVLHKMKKEGIDPKIMSFVLGDTGFFGKDFIFPTGFTEHECKITSLYANMLKLDVTHDAVHNKMTEDGIGEKIVSAVLNPVKTQDSSSSDLTEAEEAEAAPYRKMLKMMIPKDAVRHKMIRDGIASKIMDAVVNGTDDPVEVTQVADVPCRALPDSGLSEAEESVAAPYRKMLKMMMPKDAVRHKMTMDRIEPKIMKGVVGEDGPQPCTTDLTEAEEATAVTYRKMLKLSLPREAVHHRMKKEGISEKIIQAVLGKTSSSDKKGAAGGHGHKGGSKFVSLHWTPLSGTELDNSIWKANKKRSRAASQPEGSDMSKLMELFQKKNNTKAAKNKSSSSGSSGKGKAKLLDLSRANNVAISLQAFKDFSFEELADILRYVDPLHKLRGERVQFVRDLLPTTAEVTAIKSFYGSCDRLVPAERWFRNIVHIKRLESKAQVLHTMEVFDSEVSRLRANLQLLTQTCSQVLESERLRELLEMVLHIGNTLNEGTRTGGADGFKFDSLLRLTQTKSSADGKTTVLDYLVYLYAAKGQRQVLALSRDIPECQSACRMLLSDLTGEVKSVHDRLEICKKELSSLVADKDGKGAFLTTKKHAQDSDAKSDTRMQMMSAILARGIKDSRETSSEAAPAASFLKKDEFLTAMQGKDDTKTQNLPKDMSTVSDLLKSAANDAQSSQAVSPRKSLLASQHPNHDVANKNKGEAKNTPSKYQKVAKECTLEEGIARLDSFVNMAKQRYIALQSDCDLAVQTAREMSKYCGESGGERATSTVLGILSEFAESLDKAVAKYDREQEAEAKRQAKAEKEKATGKMSSSKNADTSPKRARRRPEDLQRDFGVAQTKTTPLVDSRESAQLTQIEKPPKPPAGCGKSLVLLVNEMLKEASDEAKEDFTHGLVHDNTEDDKLKAIYEREKRRRSVDGDILTTIQKRQVKSGEGETAKTRSQLARFVETMNCTPSLKAIDEEPAALEEPTTEPKEVNKFKDLQRRWSEVKASTPSKDESNSTQSTTSSSASEEKSAEEGKSNPDDPAP